MKMAATLLEKRVTYYPCYNIPSRLHSDECKAHPLIVVYCCSLKEIKMRPSMLRKYGGFAVMFVYSTSVNALGKRSKGLCRLYVEVTWSQRGLSTINQIMSVP
jgi:hypothetical protein